MKDDANPMGFFKPRTPQEIAADEKQTATHNLERYGRPDYTNDRIEAAWKLFKDSSHLPVGPERTAMADRWLTLMREGRRISNIEAARHQQVTQQPVQEQSKGGFVDRFKQRAAERGGKDRERDEQERNR